MNATFATETAAAYAEWASVPRGRFESFPVARDQYRSGQAEIDFEYNAGRKIFRVTISGVLSVVMPEGIDAKADLSTYASAWVFSLTDAEAVEAHFRAAYPAN